MKQFLPFFIIALLCMNLSAQNVYVPGSHANWNLDASNQATLKTKLGATNYYGKTIQPASGNTFKIVSNDWPVNWGGGYWIPGNSHLNTAWTLGSGDPDATWNGDNISELKQYVHLCIKNPTDYSGTNLPVGIMTLSALPTQITNVSAPATATTGDAYVIQVTLDKTPAEEEHFYVRYSSDSFVTSTIEELTTNEATATSSVMFASAGTYNWYTFSSTLSLNDIRSADDKDLLTIHYNNNSGNNYSTEVSYNKITIAPAKPDRTENFTISFNAAGTDLEGASKVYWHSGIATDGINSSTFNVSAGNWGQDDGIGQMSKKAGTTDTWEIAIASAQSYYKLSATDDAFGLNFLFRSADGSIKVDGENHENYHFELNAGNFWFFIDTPNYSPYLAERHSPFTIESTANTSLNWTLSETDANFQNPTSITSQSSGTFSYQHTITDVNTHYYQLSGELNGETKYKNLTVKGYSPVVNAPLPAQVKAGINYHSDDPTKATLVLHTPTSTNFKKGTGTISGSNTTPAKQVIYAIGDFNNWQVDEPYKLNRDGDYWWITLENLTAGQEYAFQYLVDGAIRIADPYTQKVSDPDDQHIPASTYPNLKAYPTGLTTGIASVLQTNQPNYNWEVTSFNRPISKELNIYEMHFRDFTTEGSFKAATQKMDYLKELGINCIHVMPVSEFEGNDSWGYNPNFYFALDKAYGTPTDFKQFVDEAHKRGMAVVNDLVLNHAFYSNVMARLYWDEENNRPHPSNPWFNAEHKAVYDQAGHWGADWNHESEHTQALMDAVLDFWVTEYKLDGFRFDFTKGFTQAAPDIYDPWASSYDQDRVDLLKRMVNTMWTNHQGTHAIFEHLADNSEDKVLADHGILMWSGAAPQEPYKNLALGYTTNSNYSIWSSVYASRNFTNANYVSYIESHDEERLGHEVFSYAKNISSLTGEAKTAYAIDRLKMISAFNALLPGPRMIWQFEELGYDVSINENGRTGRKPVKWEYYNDPQRKELYRVYSLLFNLRQRYDFYTNSDYGNIGANDLNTPRRMAYWDNNGNRIIVIANFDPENGHNINPGYPTTGTWYKYDGDPTVDGTTYTVHSTTESYYLEPSGFMILTNFDATATQTITFSFPSTFTYGDAPFELQSSSTSGLPVNYELISGPVTMEDNKVKIDGAGEVVIKGMQTGTAAYDPASYNQIISIDKAALTVVADDKTKTYLADLPSFSHSYLGFVNEDNISSAGISGEPYFSTLATTQTEVNQSPVLISISSGTLQSQNYQFVPEDGLLFINKADQTIIFNTITEKLVTDADFELPVTTSSGLDLEIISSNPAIASVTGNSVSIHQAGDVEFTAHQSGSDNFKAAPSVTQSLKIGVVTGIEQMSSTKLRIYPTPANDYIKIDFHNAISNVTLYNSLGSVIKQIKELKHQKQVQVSDLKPGYYILQLNSEGQIHRTRFMKQ
ncbi:MAG: T9SS type A sorting domain-containing protein [Marinilabiliaceae bacterium]|nr:T9SS type A sorting domain-containing protein [Marinilabiliaceae bacterium]